MMPFLYLLLSAVAFGVWQHSIAAGIWWAICGHLIGGLLTGALNYLLATKPRD